MVLLATLAQAVPYATYWLAFRVNEHEIAATLCERREAHCNGHCYLRKQLAKEQGASQDKQVSRQRSESVQFFEEQEDILPVLFGASLEGGTQHRENLLCLPAEIATPPPRS